MSQQILKLPTDRSFGLTFAVVSGLVAAWLWWKSSAHYPIALAVGGGFLLLALLVPVLLRPLNIVWMRFGALLNRIVSPVVLGVIYFVVLTPVATLFKLTGRDVLNRKFEADAASYWVERSPPGPDGKSSFPRQF